MKDIVWAALILSITFYSLLLLGLYLFQEKLLFPGTKLDKDYQFSFTLPFEEITIPVEGAELNALHFKQPDPQGLVFFLHGNAGNLEEWTIGVDFYEKVNYDLFIFDYRGYGKSTGKITSQKQLMEDVNTAWQSIAPMYKEKPIAIYGRSLGSALATELATTVESDLLVLVSPFSSMIDIAKEQYPFVPSALLRYPFRTDKIINNVNSPIAIIHGDKDDFIDISHSYSLQSTLTKPSAVTVINGASHSDIHEYPQYLDAFATLLRGL